MGANCSIHNDTSDETVMVFVGVNTKVVQPILWSVAALATAASGGVAMGSVPAMITLGTAAGELSVAVSVSTLTAAAGGFVSASNFVLDQLQTQLVHDLTKGGYHKCLPGQTYTTCKLSPALNLRAWVVRISRTDKAIIIQRCSASVWTGNTDNVLNKTTFPKWTKHETIPIQFEHTPTEVGMMTTSSSFNNSLANNSAGKEREADSFILLDSGIPGVQCKVVEENNNKDCDRVKEGDEKNNDDAWIQIDAVPG